MALWFQWSLIHEKALHTIVDDCKLKTHLTFLQLKDHKVFIWPRYLLLITPITPLRSLLFLMISKASQSRRQLLDSKQ